MKTQSKTKGITYTNVLIQDESGLDTIRVRKDTFISLLASRLKEIDADRLLMKAHM